MEINSDNFGEYFFDIRKNKPKKGQVLARFTAVGEFIDGRGKRDIINLLKTDKAYQAVQVMKKIHGAKEPCCYRVCREMVQDLLCMEEEDVAKKPYHFVIEQYYYTDKECIPEDKNWSIVPMITKEGDVIKSTIYL